MPEEISLTVLYREIVNLRQEVAASTAELKQKISDFGSQAIELDKRCARVERAIETIFRCRRQNNIIVFGLDVLALNNQSSLLAYIKEFFQKHLDVTVLDTDLNNIYKIGKQKNIVKIEFLSYIKKVELLKQSRRLKGTHVYIANDLSPEERDEQRILRDYSKLARDQSVTAFIRGKHLVVDDQRLTAKQLEAGEGGFVLKKPDTQQSRRLGISTQCSVASSIKKSDTEHLRETRASQDEVEVDEEQCVFEAVGQFGSRYQRGGQRRQGEIERVLRSNSSEKNKPPGSQRPEGTRDGSSTKKIKGG